MPTWAKLFYICVSLLTIHIEYMLCGARVQSITKPLDMKFV
jgi:hypothetical protein